MRSSQRSEGKDMPDYETRPLNSLVPYWRNPRRISDDAVNAVTESISRYGYQQPIVVDGEGVIIIGHTRYLALRRLGYTQATVKVVTDLTPTQVKQLRLIDNRSGEYTSWDFDKLVSEINDLDASLMTAFFPEVAVLSEEDAPEVDWLPTTTATGNDAGFGDSTDVELICPGCFHMWTQQVSKDDLRSGRIEA